ncbi:hypothetical protein CH330_04470 [candidate division WOR-3 bacterium JGI_Cruoil_03_51_56]|uniref:HD/PDEase domain-containing protein n=1 Tax=candidate division WOR-3 bacterium JGI_Cruoil_03_51_56 TaxID=1973747 RepID=A0A235BU60_UNCW3|nr:MAG: hypothetical protein CH330_04470 [candidate division WOR-3 bacterium JGI_Cruoil_03_51_56]
MIMITNKDIEEIFQEQLAGIEDAEIRSKTVQVWVEACKKGNWKNTNELCHVPFSLLVETKGIGLIEHTIAVTEGAVGLAESQIDAYSEMPYSVNMDRLIAGGLLHDVGKLLEIEPAPHGGYRKSRSGMCARHPISGAILAAQAGLPEELINVIACHSKEGDGRPQTVETVFIHQADFAAFNPLVMLEKEKLIQ